jgi:hypothetical protein
VSGTITSGCRPLPLTIYKARLERLAGRTFTTWPKRERDRLRKERSRARARVREMTNACR